MLVVMISSAPEDSLRPVQLMGKASNMITAIRFFIAIELFVGLSLDCGTNPLKTATKLS